MNSQLLAHLETFESDDEYSESPELCEEDHLVDLLDPIDAARLKTKAKIRKFVKPKSQKEIFLKILALLPVSIALGDHIGLLWSITISTICFIFLQLRPPPVQGIARRRNSSGSQGRRSSIGSGGAKRRGSMKWQRAGSIGFNNSSSHTGGSRFNPKSAASVLDLIEAVKQQVHDCRKETSRLLGLIGAPPLRWKQLDDQKLSTLTNASSSKNVGDTSLAADVNVSSIAGHPPITDEATISVVKFLEANVQYLLTIDHAFYWMKVSASLHWGLGPHSQCVERVERAAISKGFKDKRRRSTNPSTSTADGIKSSLEPHRKLDTSSILALASARRNLAQSLINQSESIVNTYRQIYLEPDNIYQQQMSQQLQCQTYIGEVNGAFKTIFDDGILEMPHVVDLAWIKASRRHIANLLSASIDYYCTIEGLQKLSDQLEKRSKLDESMWNVRNSREYLLSNLLLGKTPSVRPVVDENGGSNDKLMMSLLQYREQLDALSAALWSCQQYSKQRAPEIDVKVVLSAAEILRQEEEAESSKLNWWQQVKELSSTCQALEREIEAKFIISKVQDSTLPTKSREEAYANINAYPTALTHESGDYEHGQSVEEGKPCHSSDTISSTKTKVFSGKGALEKRNIDADSQRGSSSTLAHPPSPFRDTVAEQLLVKELQNRITALIQLDEDEEGEEKEEKESIGKSIEEDEVAEEEGLEDEIKEENVVSNNDNDYCEGDDDDDDKVDSDKVYIFNEDSDNINGDDDNCNHGENTVYVGDVQEGDLNYGTGTNVPEREAAASLFLGATGSLLNELKQSIPLVKEDKVGITSSGDNESEDSSGDEESEDSNLW